MARVPQRKRFDKEKLCSLFASAKCERSEKHLTDDVLATTASISKPQRKITNDRNSKISVKQWTNRVNPKLARYNSESETAAKQDKGESTENLSDKSKRKPLTADTVEQPPKKAKQSKISTEAVKVKLTEECDPKLDAMKERLDAGRFRYINEMLYTNDSKFAREAFKQDPSSFEVYHRGYNRQISKWPVKPIDQTISFVNRQPQTHIVADMGCGEAMLAQQVKQKVYSFDLRALNDRVTVADIAHVPLEDCSVNVVVFCLSLMGTNLSDFLKEAFRILVEGGLVWIVEVASRFSGDLQTFIGAVSQLGFKCTASNTKETHFVTLTFKKVTPTKKISSKKIPLSLTPCLYKKR